MVREMPEDEGMLRGPGLSPDVEPDTVDACTAGAGGISSTRQRTKRRNVEEALLHYLGDRAFNIDFVRAVAGDRPMAGRDHELLRERVRSRRASFYTDLLFALTQCYFPPKLARQFWQEILVHKRRLGKALGRNPGVVVAAVDYLGNVRKAVGRPAAIITADRIMTVAEVALKDGLTGLFDHMTFMNLLRREVRRHRRYGDLFAVLMIDIDDFKRVNDERGHHYGDDVLVRFARILQESVRNTDTAARYGGEEFAVLVPHAGQREALRLAERIRSTAEARLAEKGGVTVSIGVACCPDHGTGAKMLLLQADDALYRSKSAGKNRINLARIRSRTREPGDGSPETGGES
jgi:diguanylate cyclase (GGDEF)-like protein